MDSSTSSENQRMYGFFSSFRVYELKELLRHLGISTNANKKDLVDRLFQYYCNSQSSAERVGSVLNQMNKSLPSNANVSQNQKRKSDDNSFLVYIVINELKELSHDVYFEKRTFYEADKIIVPALLIDKNEFGRFNCKLEFKHNLKSGQQLHLRFYDVKDTSSVEDKCPFISQFKVNDSVGSVPNIPYELYLRKTVRKHVDITPFLVCLTGKCNLEFCGIIAKNQEFAIRIEVVNCLEVSDIIKKVPRSTRSSTESLIRQKVSVDQNDSEILMPDIKVSLLCPLGRSRIKIPGKSLACSHIQCFDLELFLQMNHKKPSWKCPICNRNIKFDNLVVESLFEDILSTTDADEVIFNEDLSWNPTNEDVKSRTSSGSGVTAMQENMNNISIIDLTNSDDEECYSTPPNSFTKRFASKWLKTNTNVISISDSPITPVGPQSHRFNS